MQVKSGHQQAEKTWENTSFIPKVGKKASSRNSENLKLKCLSTYWV